MNAGGRPKNFFGLYRR